MKPRAVVMRGDSSARTLEGLPEESKVVAGSLDGPVLVEENGARFQADLIGGQKTGWFFDQRDNRARVAALAGGARVLDAYCYAGGFGVLAACRGAAEVVLFSPDHGASLGTLSTEQVRLVAAQHAPEMDPRQVEAIAADSWHGPPDAAAEPAAVPESYLRYLVNSLRGVFELPGTPVRITLREKANPFAHKRKRKS